MKTRKTLPFVGLDIPQPDTYEALARLTDAHEICEWFRRDKAKQIKAVRQLLADDKRLQLASDMETKK